MGARSCDCCVSTAVNPQHNPFGKVHAIQRPSEGRRGNSATVTRQKMLANISTRLQPLIIQGGGAAGCWVVHDMRWYTRFRRCGVVYTTMATLHAPICCTRIFPNTAWPWATRYAQPNRLGPTASYREKAAITPQCAGNFITCRDHNQAGSKGLQSGENRLRVSLAELAGPLPILHAYVNDIALHPGDIVKARARVKVGTLPDSIEKNKREGRGDTWIRAGNKKRGKTTAATNKYGYEVARRF